MFEMVVEAFKSALETSPLIAFGLAFAGGLFTGFSPCVLPFFPAIVGYVAKNTSDSPASGRQGFFLSLFFVVGFSTTFAVIGAFASYLGGLLSLANRTWYFLVGAILIIVGLHFMQVIRLQLALPINLTAESVRLRGRAGAFVLGMLLGVVLSPCATPVVAAILTYVASKGSVALGSALLFTYSFAHGLPLMAAGTSTGFIARTSLLQRNRERVEALSGAVFIILGLYFLWLA